MVDITQSINVDKEIGTKPNGITIGAIIANNAVKMAIFVIDFVFIIFDLFTNDLRDLFGS